MSIQALRERLNSQKKEARNLLAEKGSIAWTADEQKKFDNIADECDRIETQIAAHQKMLDDEADTRFDNQPRNESNKKKNVAREATELYLRTLTKDLTQEQALMIRNTMSTTTPSEGGYGVQPTVASELIEAMKEYGAMRRVASTLNTGTGNDLSYPTSDGTSEEGEIVAQNTTAANADPSFGTVGLNVFKFSSKTITVPMELVQDAQFDILGFIQRRIRDRIGRIGNRMFTVGVGTTQPLGLGAAAVVGKTGITGQTLTVTYDDLVDLVDSLDEAYQGDECKFMFSQTVRRTVRKIKDTAGRPIWTPSYDQGMTAKSPDLLLGHAVEINNHMPVPAANAKSIAFGDLSKYTIRDAMQVTLFKFEDSAFISKGQIGFLAWCRMGGNLLDVNAVKQYQHSAT